MRTYTTKTGDMVDAICQEIYGDESQATEAVLDANPGLADHGVRLPAGIVITLPDIETSDEIAVVTLWT